MSWRRSSQNPAAKLTLLCRVDQSDLAERTFSSAVVSFDLHLEGTVRRQAVVVVDVSGRLHVRDTHYRPRLCILLPEGKDVDEAIAVLVLSGHRLEGTAEH